MKYNNKQIYIYFLFILPLILFNCNKDRIQPKLYKTTKIDLTHFVDLSDSSLNFHQSHKLILLQSDSDTGIREPGKLLLWNDEFILLDLISKSIVKFSKEGDFICSFGRLGQGPGEYITPWDIDIDSIGLYVLDQNSRKVLLFNHKGNYVKESKLPFCADAFTKLKTGNFLFNLLPAAESVELIMTDSLFEPIKEIKYYDKDYVGGLVTKNIFRKTKEGNVTYYRSPLDEMLVINTAGEIIESLDFELGDREINDLGKKDYMTYFMNHPNDNPLLFIDSPLLINSELLVGKLEDDRSEYALLYNFVLNKAYIKSHETENKLADIFNPVYADEKGNIISLINYEMVKNCSDYEVIPDSIRNRLESGDRMLLFVNIQSQ